MSEYDQIAAQMPNPFRLLWRNSASSTNDEMREFAERGMAAGLVLVAEEQTAGRGRRGADWYSSKGESLTFSVLLRPVEPKVFWSRLSLVAGLAVAEALDKFLPLVEIKWPNDVLIDGKKIAGILVEAGADFVIIGIGINVNTENHPAGLAATSLKLECGGLVKRAEVLHGVVTALAKQVGKVEIDFASVRRGISERCALTGKWVAFTSLAERHVGMVKGIGEGGELLVEISGIVQSFVQADEVRVIR